MTYILHEAPHFGQNGIDKRRLVHPVDDDGATVAVSQSDVKH